MSAGPQCNAGSRAAGGQIGNSSFKGPIGDPPGTRGAQFFFPGDGKIPVKCFSGRVWGEMALPKGLLGTIQSISLAQIPVKTHHWGTISSTQSCFFGPRFHAKKVPSPVGSQICYLGSQTWSLGLKIQKLCTDKPCRIQWSVFQTEPYGAS